MYLFNVRVYGLLINDNHEILVSDEQEYGMRFTKFPGGGLEYGEGMTEGLKREFMEECNLDIEIISHFYTTDFFVKSAFNESQIISIYYVVQNIAPFNLAIKTQAFDFDDSVETITVFPLDKTEGFEGGRLYVPNRSACSKTIITELMNLVERDLNVIWHPYTQMKTAGAPIPIVRGEGAYLFDEDGKRYIDAISSWWTNIHGHAHPYIAKKVAEQLTQLEHVIFAGFTHPKAVELAEKLLAILPGNQKKAFYSDNGSTAVEVAIKMCLQYWNNQGRMRTKMLAFKNAYHGDTFGAMAVSGRSAFTAAFDPLLFEVEFIDLPTENNINNLKSQISDLKSQLACFIFEPLVQGTAGMVMYEAKYLNELLAHCRKEHVLTIADEVFTGFGRTGKPFATSHINEQADIMCFSKGLTGGTMALGLTTCTQEIFNAFLSDDKLKTLFHGHSFTANPVACASALASMEIFQDPATAENIQRITALHAEYAQRIEGHPKIKTVRQLGTIIAMEWETGSSTSYFSTLRDKLYYYFLEAGIILRPLGNIVYILPPYCIKDADLNYIYGKIEQALNEI